MLANPQIYRSREFQCCVGDMEEEEDTAVSGDEADEMEMEEYLEGRKNDDKKPITRTEIEMTEVYT